MTLPANGLIAVRFRGHIKHSTGAASAQATVFLDDTQTANMVGASEVASTSSTTYKTLVSYLLGLTVLDGASEVTTGQHFALTLEFYATAGTYTGSVRYQTSAGSVSVQHRRLYVETKPQPAS